jgi:arabinan endo-1,5-alpha-L-arabinosidase
MIARRRGAAADPDRACREMLRHVRIRARWAHVVGLRLTIAAAVTLFVLVAAAGAPPLARAGQAPPAPAPGYANPLTVGHKPLSCPDPSVIKVHRGKWNYFLFCTSDNARNAFPIWMSSDLVHWHPDGAVFPHGHQPSWAVPSTGSGRAGIFWAPAISRIDGRWVLYFSAVYDRASHAIGAAALAPGTMVLGMASSDSLAGPWHATLLHFPGELNALNQRPDQELVGGDIDPGVVQDPVTHQRYIFWAEQREQIWESELSANGLAMGPDIRIAFSVSEPWECDPGNRLCTVEGPQPIYHDGRFYVLYSGASTWDSTYVVGVAASPAVLDPAQPFEKLYTPILRAGNGFLGPGGESDPVLAPNGQEMIMYHALTHPVAHHNSSQRVLMLGLLRWVNGWPVINNGVAG